MYTAGYIRQVVFGAMITDRHLVKGTIGKGSKGVIGVIILMSLKMFLQMLVLKLKIVSLI